MWFNLQNITVVLMVMSSQHDVKWCLIVNQLVNVLIFLHPLFTLFFKDVESSFSRPAHHARTCASCVSLPGLGMAKCLANRKHSPESCCVWSLPSTNAFGPTLAFGSFFKLRSMNICWVVCCHSGDCQNRNCSEKALVPFYIFFCFLQKVATVALQSRYLRLSVLLLVP